MHTYTSLTGILFAIPEFRHLDQQSKSFVFRRRGDGTSSLLGFASVQQGVETEERVVSTTGTLLCVLLVHRSIFVILQQIHHKVVGLSGLKVVVNTASECIMSLNVYK